MSTDTDRRQESCEERIVVELVGRVALLRALQQLADYSMGDDLSRVALDVLGESMIEMPEREDDEDGIREAGRERMVELPLGVSSKTVFRIDLSTGGPGDWLEVECDYGGDRSEPHDGSYSIEGITYHFNDWFDHAERTLDGDDLATAEAFARQVVPELQ